MKNKLINKRQQKGIALAYVLMIFSLVSIMSYKIINNLWINIDKNTHFIQKIQAKHFAISSENYIINLLEKYFSNTQHNQSYTEYNKTIFDVNSIDFNIKGLKIETQIIDENKKFNINWLSSIALDGKDYNNQFNLLLEILSINTAISDSIKEYISNHKQYSYMTNKLKNSQIFTSIYELLSLPNLSMEEFNMLQPYITALPNKTKLNINTASSYIIMSLSDQISESDAQNLLDTRSYNSFTKISDLTQIEGFQDKTAILKSKNLSFKSNYFNVHIRVNYLNELYYMRSLLFKNDKGKISILEREIGIPQNNPYALHYKRNINNAQ